MSLADKSQLDLEVFLAAIESARHAIFVTNSEGLIEYVNPASRKNLWLSRKT